jgi:hypothetical protein
MRPHSLPDDDTRPGASPTATDRCPRCGGSFHCGAQDARPCPCGQLTLSPALQADLRRRYTGCLCLPCLAALARATPAPGLTG